MHEYSLQLYVPVCINLFKVTLFLKEQKIFEHLLCENHVIVVQKRQGGAAKL